MIPTPRTGTRVTSGGRGAGQGPRLGGGIDPPIVVPRWRTALVFGVLALGLCALGVKAGRLQLLLGDDLRGLAENQYLRKVKVAAPRGDIVDHAGRPLAKSVAAWSVSARPSLVEDKQAAAAALAPLLGVDTREVLAELTGGDKFVWLERRAALDVAEGVRRLGIPGVALHQDTRRTWPQKALAGQLLGLVDIDGRAQGGVEQAFDESLEGRAQQAPALIDNKGDRIAVGDGLDLALLDGDDVALTLDVGVQHEAEDALAATVIEHGAKSGWALAMDARTGALLAVANYPPFNPNAPEMNNARNLAFAEAFEPGSIFKIATFAAALEAGAVKPSDRIYCENGRFQVGRHVIHDTHRAEWLTAQEVFQESSNIGTLKIAQRLGEDAMKAALLRFHFGEQPGTGLIEETPGRLPSKSHWGDARLATVSFGHGLLVSALQMVSLAQAVANGGVRMTPHLLDRVTTHDGEVVRRAPLDEGERIMSAGTARTLTEIMETVEHKGGTGTLAAITGIEVAGKTGTAEKVDPVTHRYSNQLHMASFVGFAPANDPKIVAIVVVDEPQGPHHFGGLVAAPAWRRIVERALAEDGVLAQAQLADTPLVGKDAAVLVRAAREGAVVDDVGDAAADRADAAGARVTGASEGHAADGDRVAVDLRGLGARAALSVAEKAGVEVELAGSGVVASQQPAPGKRLAAGERIRALLADPSAPPLPVDPAPAPGPGNESSSAASAKRSSATTSVKVNSKTPRRAKGGG